jgi:hypothetical protein
LSRKPFENLSKRLHGQVAFQLQMQSEKYLAGWLGHATRKVSRAASAIFMRFFEDLPGGASCGARRRA